MVLDDQENSSEESNTRRIRRAILASVGATAGIALVSSLLGKNSTFVRISEEVGIVQKKAPYDTLVSELKLKYSRLDKIQQEAFIENYIKDKAPYQILSIVRKLFSEKDPLYSGPLALRIASKSSDRYGLDRLKLLTALEYIKGISLEKNLMEAKKILELPELQENALASYYRGIWWSETTNPSRNLVEAEINLKFAASHGIKAAEKALIKLEIQANSPTIRNPQ